MKMALTKEQQEDIRKKFEENVKNIDKDDVEYAAKKGFNKVNEFGENPPSSLAVLWNGIKLMISLLSDVVKGNYKDTPWNIIASVAGAIFYFVSPIDIIPDFIPVVGYIDDAFVLKLALDFASIDLKKYEEWKKKQ